MHWVENKKMMNVLMYKEMIFIDTKHEIRDEIDKALIKSKNGFFKFRQEELWPVDHFLNNARIFQVPIDFFD
jgi:hypothetical protein